MPRLPFWGFSVAATIGASYAGCILLYRPQHAFQQTEEQRLSVSQLRYQNVLRSYAQMRVKAEMQLDSPEAATGVINAEKLFFFCDVQQMRSLLLSLPHHFTTEKDLHQMLDQLSDWEKRHCNDLNFRTAALSMTQMLRSMTCLVIYLVCFRVLGPMIGAFQGLEQTRVRLLHCAAVHITRALEIQVTLSEEEGTQSKEHALPPMTRASPPAALLPGSEEWKRNETTTERQQMSASAAKQTLTRQVLLRPTHWIEEVGFWACPDNPLLRGSLSPAASLACGSASSRSVSAGTARFAPWRWLMHGSALATPGAHSITYARHWQTVAASEQVQEEAQLVGSRKHLAGKATISSPLTPHAIASEVSFGYPVLSHPRCLSDDDDNGTNGGGDGNSNTPRFIPVGVSGLPQLLYVDAQHAKPDVRRQQTREEVYARHEQAQYSRAAPSPLPSSQRLRDSAAGSASASPQVLSELQQWRERGGLPWWHKAWWGGVYGGRQRHTTSMLCSLHYHLGRSCLAADYASEAAAASKAAEAFRCTSLL